MLGVKKFIYKLLLIAFCALATFGIYFLTIVKFTGSGFSESYQSVIQIKYNNLVSCEGKKIVIIGGSSAGFGIDETLLEESTGYSVVNLGLLGGFGNLFNTEISKDNINEGDIILLAYEYGWESENSFEKLGIDLVMSGIDDDIEMYRKIPLSKWTQVLGYINSYSSKKFTAMTTEQKPGVYSRAAFDDKGRMIYEREKYILDDYVEKKSTYGEVNLKDVSISENSISYLKKYKEYIESKGASIYFTVPPLLDKAKSSDDESFLNFVEEEESTIGIEYISNPLDYIFHEDFMYDTIYHCNDLGEEKRTQLLLQDIQENILK